MALWSGRFMENVSEFTQRFGASLPVDKALYAQDIAGSKAPAKMLATVGVISEDDAQQIAAGALIASKPISSQVISCSISTTRISHMSVEKALTAEIGDAGARLHTGGKQQRSGCNGYAPVCQAACNRSDARQCCARHALIGQAEANFGVILPGYTHLQHAQPGPVLAPYACVCLDACARLSPFAGCTRCGRRLSAGRSCAGWDNVSA